MGLSAACLPVAENGGGKSIDAHLDQPANSSVTHEIINQWAASEVVVFMAGSALVRWLHVGGNYRHTAQYTDCDIITRHLVVQRYHRHVHVLVMAHHQESRY